MPLPRGEFEPYASISEYTGTVLLHSATLVRSPLILSDKFWLTKFQFILKVFDAVEVKTFWRPVCFSATSNLGIFSLSPSEHGSVMMLKQKKVSLKRLLPCWKWNCVEFIRQWKQWLHIIYILTTKWTAAKVQLQEKVLYSVIWSELTEVVCNLPDLITFLIKCSHFNFNWYQKKNDISFVQLIPATSEKSNYTNTKNQIIIIW